MKHRAVNAMKSWEEKDQKNRTNHMKHRVENHMKHRTYGTPHETQHGDSLKHRAEKTHEIGIRTPHEISSGKPHKSSIKLHMKHSTTPEIP